MSEEDKKKGEEGNPGVDTPGVEKTTSEVLIERSDGLSKENDRLKTENADLKMKIASHEIGGKSVGGDGSGDGKEYSEEEKASRARIKAIGDASGSAWAKDYE